jgi:hypothetical protein
MRNIIRTLTVVTALGALTPLAAHADAGLHMYQPSPLITQTHHQRTATASNNATAQANQNHTAQRNS